MMRTYFMRSDLKSLTILAMTVSTLSACSSTTEIHENPTIPEVPEYVKVPHPVNFELASLRAIFFNPLAPKDVQAEFSENCDQDFQKLAEASNSLQERKDAAIEMVSVDPERMHWCFYAKISKLQDTLQSDTTWNQRQKKVLRTFVFLSPLANAFLEVYHDSRYLRWATQYYSKISEWVFFRKVTPSPDSSLAVISGANDGRLEPWIPVESKVSKRDSVFSKYGISLQPTIASGTNPLDYTERMPASEEPVTAAPVTATETAKAELKPIQVEPQVEKPATVMPPRQVEQTVPEVPSQDTGINY